MFEPLVTAAEMRAAEEAYPGFPGTASELMERAGTAVAIEAMSAFPGCRRFAVVCGKGSNGGDGRIAARMLRQHGREGVVTREPEGFDVVIDALLGTGARGAPRPALAKLIGRINACGVPVVAVDLPSGVDASTGEVPGAAIAATLTVTFHARKLGQVVAPGRFHTGHVVVADIGLQPQPAAARRAREAILRLVPRRSAIDSKFSAGSVLVVGGAPGTTSAAVLSAMAALRADAGYVTLAVPRAALSTAESLALEPVKRGFRWADAVETLMPDVERSSALAIGSGLGRSREAKVLVRRLLEQANLPAVVDADALHELEPVPRAAPTVLTPHAGELARMLGWSSDAVGAARLDAARQAAEQYQAVIVLKGADTIVQAPGAAPVVADHGPPSLATAGTGDVLTGVIAAFLAKGLDPVDAAAAGAVAHGLAAARAHSQSGLIASDLLELLPAVLG
ncbi:MAG: NAD(P)H-hydrate dehydratase [Gaiella sp.]